MNARGMLAGLIISVFLWALLIGGYAVCFGETQFNPHTGHYETTDPGDTLKFNPFEGTYSYESPDSEIEFNPFEGTYDYAEPDDYDPYD